VKGQQYIGLLVIVLLVCSPISLAGITAPETASFGAVDSSGYVNLFTGDLSVPISLMTVPGTGGLSYPISISYSPGISPKTKAGIVGLGWNLVVDGVTRTVRGYPDDYSGLELAGGQVQPNVLRKVDSFVRDADLECSYKDSSNRFATMLTTATIGLVMAATVPALLGTIGITFLGATPIPSTVSGLASQSVNQAIFKNDPKLDCGFENVHKPLINEQSDIQVRGRFYQGSEDSLPGA